MFRSGYSNVFTGTADWQKIGYCKQQDLRLESDSNLCAKSAFSLRPCTEVNGGGWVTSNGPAPGPCWANSITTDHISPAGAIKPESPPVATGG